MDPINTNAGWKDYKMKLQFQVQSRRYGMINVIITRLYPACHNEDMQAINVGSPNVHINLQTVQQVKGGKGKMVGEQPCPIKKPLFFLNKTEMFAECWWKSSQGRIHQCLSQPGGIQQNACPEGMFIVNLKKT